MPRVALSSSKRPRQCLRIADSTETGVDKFLVPVLLAEIQGAESVWAWQIAGDNEFLSVANRGFDPIGASESRPINAPLPLHDHAFEPMDPQAFISRSLLPAGKPSVSLTTPHWRACWISQRTAASLPADGREANGRLRRGNRRPCSTGGPGVSHSWRMQGPGSIPLGLIGLSGVVPTSAIGVC